MSGAGEEGARGLKTRGTMSSDRRLCHMRHEQSMPSPACKPSYEARNKHWALVAIQSAQKRSSSVSMDSGSRFLADAESPIAHSRIQSKSWRETPLQLPHCNFTNTFIPDSNSSAGRLLAAGHEGVFPISHASATSAERLKQYSGQGVLQKLHIGRLGGCREPLLLYLLFQAFRLYRIPFDAILLGISVDCIVT